MTITAAEITDTRIEVIAHAREVLERARSEYRAWRGDRKGLNRVVAVMAAIEGALRPLDKPCSEEEIDHVVRMCTYLSVQVVAVVEDVMGRDAAFFVAGGDNSDEEGEWVA